MVQYMQEFTDAIASKEAAEGSHTVEVLIMLAFFVVIAAFFVGFLSPIIKSQTTNTGNLINSTLAGANNTLTH